MKNSNIIILILAIIVAGAGGFWGGTTYQKTQRVNTNNRVGAANRNWGTPRPGNLGANRPMAGEITAIDDKSITVKMPDGSSKIIIYSGSTKVSKTTDGGVSDLKTGIQISVVGTTGTDGTVTAQNIFIGGRL